MVELHEIVLEELDKLEASYAAVEDRDLLLLRHNGSANR